MAISIRNSRKIYMLIFKLFRQGNEPWTKYLCCKQQEIIADTNYHHWSPIDFSKSDFSFSFFYFYSDILGFALFLVKVILRKEIFRFRQKRPTESGCRSTHENHYNYLIVFLWFQSETEEGKLARHCMDIFSRKKLNENFLVSSSIFYWQW